MSWENCTNKLPGLPVTLVLATASTRQPSLWGRKGMRGKKSFSGRCLLVGVEAAHSFPKLWERKCLDFWRWKKAAPAAEMWQGLRGVKTKQHPQQPWHTKESLGFILHFYVLLINHLQLLGPGSGGCLHPDSRHMRTWRRPGFPTAPVLLGLPAVCVGLAVSLWHQMYRPWSGNTDIWRLFPWGKRFLYFFCSNTLMKFKHDCTYRGSLERAQRSEGRCERGNEPNPSMENWVFRGKLLKPYSVLAARVFLDCSGLSSGRCKEQFNYFLFIPLQQLFFKPWPVKVS